MNNAPTGTLPTDVFATADGNPNPPPTDTFFATVLVARQGILVSTSGQATVTTIAGTGITQSR